MEVVSWEWVVLLGGWVEEGSVVVLCRLGLWL